MTTEAEEQIQVEQDEETELQEEETPETETEEIEPEQEEESPEAEYYDTEEDLFEELGVGRMTAEQAAAMIKEQKQQIEAIKTVQPQQTIPQYQPQFQPQPKPQEGEFKFLPNRGMAKKRVEDMQYSESDDGRAMRSNNIKSAQFFDSVLDPVLDNLEDNQQSLRSAIFQIAQHLQKQSYDGYRGKDMVKFEDLQPMMMQNFILDAGQAANQFLAQNNPQRLVEIQQRAQKEGERRALKKRFKKSSSTRRQKSSQPKGVSWQAFYNRDGSINTEKLYKLAPEDRVKITEARLRDIQKEYEGK